MSRLGRDPKKSMQFNIGLTNTCYILVSNINIVNNVKTISYQRLCKNSYFMQMFNRSRAFA